VNAHKNHLEDAPCSCDLSESCSCGCEEEEALLFYDLRDVSPTRLACPGEDLVDLLAYDPEVDEATYARLGLTPPERRLDDDGNEFFVIPEIDPEGYYVITFPEDEDPETATFASAIALEPIDREAFEALPPPEADDPCDGDCDRCPQDCVGKQPIA